MARWRAVGRYTATVMTDGQGVAVDLVDGEIVELTSAVVTALLRDRPDGLELVPPTAEVGRPDHSLADAGAPVVRVRVSDPTAVYTVTRDYRSRVARFGAPDRELSWRAGDTVELPASMARWCAADSPGVLDPEPPTPEPEEENDHADV